MLYRQDDRKMRSFAIPLIRKQLSLNHFLLICLKWFFIGRRIFMWLFHKTLTHHKQLQLSCECAHVQWHGL